MLRLVDANLNRAREGLRVLEDVARFLLNDDSLTQDLRRLRHGLRAEGGQTQLMLARDAAADVGSTADLARDRLDLPDLVRANACRVEESLRALEEFGQLPELASILDSARFQQARFALYALEQKLLFRLLRQDKLAQLRGLYIIIDARFLGGRSEIEVARLALRGGARAIQLRDKGRDHGQLLPLAQELRHLCSQQEALFIVNDHLDLALASGADGLHLGQTDLPLAQARRLLPLDKILGCSTHTLEQALRAQAEGADYIAVGSIYPTSSKEASVAVGLDMIRQVKQQVSLPIVAIGGINRDNVAPVMAAGAQAAAVMSAVVGAEDVEGAARSIVARIES